MPDLNIPTSSHTVDVSVIDSTSRIRVPTAFFIQNPVKGHETLECPAYAFLVQHPTGTNVLFDLGLRPDLESLPPVIRHGMADLDMSAEKGIASILQEHGIVTPERIDSIIWRYEPRA